MVLPPCHRLSLLIMSHSSYTASERRGVLAIAIIALLIIAVGVGMSLINQNKAEAEVLPQVIEHPEMIDTTAVVWKERKSKLIKSKSVGSSEKPSKKKLDKKKAYRRRNPLEEPV